MPEYGLQERYVDMANADKVGEKLPKDRRITLREAISSHDLAVLVQQTVVDTLRDSAEPVYIGSRMMRRVRLMEGRSIVFPSISAIRAHWVPEGGPYPEENPEFQRHEAELEVKVQKAGLVIRVTDEMLDDSQWDVIGIMVEQAGRAMARLKEETIFREFTRHGHVIVDGDYYQIAKSDGGTVEWDSNDGTFGAIADKKGLSDPGDISVVPSGLDINGNLNGTVSVEDFLDMFLHLMGNEYIPTDVLMHPLVWPMVAKNEILGKLTLAGFGGQENKITVTPEAVQGRLPFELTVTLTPFVPFNLADKKFDMYVVARNDVGVILEKESLQTERWDNPERDIQNIKVKERYGIGIFDEGKPISLAKNIRYAKTYPFPQRVKQL